MNDFEKQIDGGTGDGLRCLNIDILQLNLGLKCNQQCHHCHLEAAPHRKEMMDWPTMERVLKAAKEMQVHLVDLTGGSPELNPYFRHLLMALREQTYSVQVRTNLTVLLETGLEDLPDFFRDYQIHLVASMPCYLEENVCAQRGKGVYEKSIAAIQRLNALGYGRQPDLPLNLVYNPGGPFLPPLRQLWRKNIGASWIVDSASPLLDCSRSPTCPWGDSERTCSDDTRNKII